MRFIHSLFIMDGIDKIRKDVLLGGGIHSIKITIITDRSFKPPNVLRLSNPIDTVVGVPAWRQKGKSGLC